MLYDEGFDVQLGEYSFFAFSNYSIENIYGNRIVFKSKCYSTCTGWYINKDKSKRGCYQAMKLGIDPFKDTYINTKLSVNNADNLIHSDISNRPDTLPMHYSFLSEKESFILNAHFSNHQSYVKFLNGKVKKNWKASVYPQYNSKSINQLNRLAGIPRFKSKTYSNPEKMNTEDLQYFPLNFDWKSLVRPAPTQGECGSCYALSTARMMEARLKLMYNHDVSISAQHVLDCSFYNQGCNGGYPFLVMKFGNEFEMIPEFCKPYTGTNSKCDTSCNISKLPLSYKFINYYYVGGSYGRCNEKVMMKELQKNGPFVVSFQPDYNFMFYKTGIYHSLELGSWIKQGLSKPEWEKVDHSVLLVGWGQDPFTGEKFWILQNTWGAEWGEDGFFRMKRGVDEFSIESLCEAGTPIIVDNLTKLPLLPDTAKNKVVIKTTGNISKFRNGPITI